MGHSLNHGLTTNMKGPTMDSFRVSIGAAGAPTLAEDCGAGLISATISHPSAGVYTFQMVAPYPPKLVDCIAEVASAAITDQVLKARYQAGSYNATTGQFTVMVSSLPTSTTAAAADPPSGAELHVTLITRRYTANP